MDIKAIREQFYKMYMDEFQNPDKDIYKLSDLEDVVAALDKLIHRAATADK